MTANEHLIEGVRILGEGSPVDIEVKGTRIRSISPSKKDNGLIVLPGLVDLHTHLREPGNEVAEDISTASASAAAGGFTCVHAMANTVPVQDNAALVERVALKGQEVGLVDVQPIGAVSVGLNGEKLADLGAMESSKARVKVFSDDGKCVSDPMLMRRALEYVKAFGGVIAQHAQEPALTVNSQMNDGVISAEIGLTGWPGVAEEAIIARDILLADYLSSKYHVCHVSTARSVEIVRVAKAKGIAITAEVTPHHLNLTEEEVRGYDARFKVNPPLRTAEDVVAVREALADGTIDIVATDHAPHSRENKEQEFQQAAFGMTGLETALSAVQKAMVDTGLMTWTDVARVLSSKPAEIGQVDLVGGGVMGLGEEFAHGAPVVEGAVANFVVYNPAVTSVIEGAAQQTRSANTPFEGRELPGQVVATYLRGKKTF